MFIPLYILIPVSLILLFTAFVLLIGYLIKDEIVIITDKTLKTD